MNSITNTQIAEDIGLTHSGVSRIRSGDRLPSISVMAKIADVYGWSPDSQMAARFHGKYPERFEEVLEAHYAAKAAPGG